jgi:hypothetical protein
MQAKIPKNTKQHYWTMHVLGKMKHYGLSAQKVLGVIRRPVRKEEGIVEKTIAVMQPISPKLVNGKNTWKQEIWVMYQIRKDKTQLGGLKKTKSANSAFEKLEQLLQSKDNQIKIISAWRYPGISPEKNPIPEEILRELEDVE